MDLSRRISDSVNRAYEKDDSVKDFIKVDKVYWYPTKSDFTGDNIKVYDLLVRCFDFYCVENLLLLVVEEGMKIYRFDGTLKLIKSLKHHLLIFLIRKEGLREAVKNFFYKILLYLVRDETIRIESHLEGIMLYLEVDEILDIRECQGHVEIVYRNGEVKYYDGRLQGIPPRDEKSKRKMKPNTLVKIQNKSIFIFRDLVRIEFSSGISKKEINTKKIEKVVESERIIFIKTEDSIKAIEFN